jgi:Fe-Mn family superoxide dismutase
MSDAIIDRRNLLVTGALLTVGAAALAPAGAIAAQAAAPSSTSGFTPKPLPLPFDPKSITGLSERMLVSHHDNNYVGAVKRLGAIAAQAAALDPVTAPGFMLNGLKHEELVAWN